jgi:hypothetical protein
MHNWTKGWAALRFFGGPIFSEKKTGVIFPDQAVTLLPGPRRENPARRCQ